MRITGLPLSVVVMGMAAELVGRHRWLAWLGLLVVLRVALRLIWAGAAQIAARLPNW